MQVGLVYRGRYHVREALDLETYSAVLQQAGHHVHLFWDENTFGVTDNVLQSAVVQHAIDHLAASPELRQAVADQTVGMAQQTIDGVRRRSVALDDVAEQTVRRWLRRQPHQSS